MPPKTKAATAADDKKTPSWEWGDEDNEEAWTPYGAADQALIEPAFQMYKAAKKKTKDVNEVLIINGNYFVDFRLKLQKKVTDTSRQRPVRRVE